MKTFDIDVRLMFVIFHFWLAVNLKRADLTLRESARGQMPARLEQKSAGVHGHVTVVCCRWMQTATFCWNLDGPWVITLKYFCLSFCLRASVNLNELKPMPAQCTVVNSRGGQRNGISCQIPRRRRLSRAWKEVYLELYNISTVLWQSKRGL